MGVVEEMAQKAAGDRRDGWDETAIMLPHNCPAFSSFKLSTWSSKRKNPRHGRKGDEANWFPKRDKPTWLNSHPVVHMGPELMAPDKSMWLDKPR